MPWWKGSPAEWHTASFSRNGTPAKGAARSGAPAPAPSPAAPSYSPASAMHTAAPGPALSGADEVLRRLNSQYADMMQAAEGGAVDELWNKYHG